MKVEGVGTVGLPVNLKGLKTPQEYTDLPCSRVAYTDWSILD